MSEVTFRDIGLNDELVQAVEGLGFEAPSKIQALAIPKILEGGDIIGLSATGSGKTAAFTLPALQMIDPGERGIQVIILSPTRELCMQVCEEVGRLSGNSDDIRAVPVYGGAPMDRQIRGLNGRAQIVVGTPGRLLDHLRRGTLRTNKVRMVILDEADRMLDMGFREDMEHMLSQIPDDRQTLFFSATMNKQVEKLIQRFGNNPEPIEVQSKAKTVDTIDQSYYEVRNRSKVEVLSRLLDMQPPKLAVIFCNTKRSVDECTEALLARGYSADRLHGDITQALRERTINRFRDGAVELLVATDVAARGLDIEDVEMVFNYDLPQDPEDYVHRIGRTGRAGRSGRAVSFVFGRDVYRLQNVERYTKCKIQHARIPSKEEVEGKRADVLFDSLRDRIEKDPKHGYNEYIDRLLEQGHAATDIAGVLFSMLRESIGREGEEIQEDRPQRERRGDRNDRGDRRERRQRDDRGERGERRERRDRDDFGRDDRGGKSKRGDAPRLKEGDTQLFIGLGTGMGFKTGDLAGMLYSETRVGDGQVGRIRMFPKHALVQVPLDKAQMIIDDLKGVKLKGRHFKCWIDRDI